MVKGRLAKTGDSQPLFARDDCSVSNNGRAAKSGDCPRFWLAGFGAERSEREAGFDDAILGIHQHAGDEARRLR